MRSAAGTLCLITLAVFVAAQQPPAPPVSAVGPNAMPQSDSAAATQPVIIPPPPTPRELAEAKKKFASGSRLKARGKTEEAYGMFTRASELDAHNVEYATARELTRQELVMEALARGNEAMAAKDEVVATSEFRRALELDPSNEFARQRLKDAIWEDDPAPTHPLRVAQKSIEISLSPSPGVRDFHFKGDSRGLLIQVAKAYNITATVDDSVTPRQVRFDMDKATFAAAMEAATRVTKTFWTALSGSQAYFVGDTLENRRNFERLAIRTFYLSEVLAPQELTELVQALRVIFEIRFVQQDASQSTVTVRAPLPVVEAASQLIESLAVGRPQVMLDVRVYQISSSLMRQLGTQLPNQFTMFNISPALIASLGAGAQNLINQLIASGGINQANSQAIQALLAQLQQSSQNPLLSTPFATFGGGLTFMGVSATPPIAINAQVNESDIRNLEHVELLASQNSPAVMKIGERYPIVNATFAPIFNSSAISHVIGNQSYVAPFPSFNFEDLGLNLKATPVIHSNSDVSLKLELNIRTLGTQTVNGIPVVNNREYSGNITLKNEESGVVAGLLSKEDSRSLSGYPFVSRVPGISYASAVHDKNVSDDELLVVITPHITRMAPREGFAVQLPVGQ